MKYISTVILFLALIGCTKQPVSTLNLIPLPQQVEQCAGSFSFDSTTTFYISGRDEENLSNHIRRLFPTITKGALKTHNQIQFIFEPNDSLSTDWYSIDVTTRLVQVKSSTPAGLFYALQTLQQSIQCDKGSCYLPCMRIFDAPRYSYRGMHLDVSRHFFSVDFIKKQLDAMAHYKLNRFHWHLVDGAGWRMQVETYPLLTEQAAWHVGKWKEWWAGDRHYCTANTLGAYGGFYTKEEMREVVAYAAERYIEVIPEIEMPGHSDEVTAVYPQLGCSGKPYTNGDLCVGNEETFKFIEDVLTEVMDIFPSKYIHVGGDEAGKDAWKTCSKCQQRVKEEHLGSMDELQGYMMRRVESFLKEHGREMIGWNEVAKDDLSHDAVIMAWTNVNDGFAAAKDSRKVIMSPGEYCYLDMYQANPMREEMAIGGYIPIEKCYSFDPIPHEYEEPQRSAIAEQIIGVQGNVWTEYIPTEEHAEHMIYPRLLALAEVAWTPSNRRVWNDFKARVNAHIPLLRAAGYNAFELSDEPRIEQKMLLDKHEVKLTMSSERTPIEIRYTMDGTLPTPTSALYVDTITLSDAVTLQAALFKDGTQVGPVVKQIYGFHKALGKHITYNNAGFGAAYPGGGATALVDGVVGSFSYTDGHWQGFSENDMDVTIDLGSLQTVSTVSATFMQLVGPWIWLPKEVEISASVDGKDFVTLATLTNTIPTTQEGLILQPFGWEGATQARFIRYRAQTCGVKHGWMFVDEIFVN